MKLIMSCINPAYLEQLSLNLQAPVLEKKGHTGWPGWVSVEMSASAGNSPCPEIKASICANTCSFEHT